MHGRDQVWLIYVVMVLYGLAYGVLGSGESALLREMLPEELLGNANGILQTFRQGSLGARLRRFVRDDNKMETPAARLGPTYRRGGAWVTGAPAARISAAMPERGG